MIARVPLGQVANASAGAFQPYPLFDYSTGLYDAKESWLAPRGALDRLENAHVFRGRIHKRRGRSRLGELSTDVTGEVLEATSVKDDYSGTVANTPITTPKGAYAPTFRSTAADAQQAYVDPEIVGTTTSSVTGEVIYIPPGTVAGISFQLASFPIAPGSLVLKNASGSTIAVDLGNGKLSGAYEPTPGALFSEINYQTGAGWIIFDTPDTAPFTANYSAITGTLGNLVLQDAPQATGLTPTTPTWAFSGGRAVQPGSFRLEDSSGTPKVITDDGEGGLVGGAGLAGAIDYDTGTLTGLTLPTGWTNTATLDFTARVGYLDLTTGDFAITLLADTAASGNFVIDYGYNRGLPVMAIRSFFDTSQSEYVVALDTRRLFLWSSNQGRFVDQCLSDIFTGDDDDFPWLEPFEDTLRIANGVDAPHTYEPGSGGAKVYPSGLDIDGDASDELDSAQIVLRGVDNSLVYLNTVEEGTAYPTRARTTPVNDVDYASGNAATAELFVDCPTEDEIVTAERLGNDFLVGMKRSFWLLQYTGDPLLPYEWKRVPMAEGAVAKKASVALSEQVVTRGQTGIVAVDGVGEQPLDTDVPDVTLAWNPDAARYSQAHHALAARQVLLSYAGDEDKPEKALVLQYDDQRTRRSFSLYDFPFHAIGEYRRENTLLWDDLTDLLDNYTFILDQASQRAGFPVVLVGDRGGVVYEWGVLSSDDGAAIEARMLFTRLNPFPLERAHLGYIDIIAAAHSGLSLRVNVYADFSETPYHTALVSLEPASTGAADQKVKRRVRVNRIASWHRIELVETSAVPFELDGVIPYFRPAGLMRNVTP